MVMSHETQINHYALTMQLTIYSNGEHPDDKKQENPKTWNILWTSTQKVDIIS